MTLALRFTAERHFLGKEMNGMVKKTIIGVIPLWDEDKSSFWMLPGYLNGIMEAGGCPITLPLSDDYELIYQLAMQFDGFLFTGGQDISPSLYNEKKSDKCGHQCEPRDVMESKLFKILLDLDKPALGICRGIQLFNALLGGNLYQDIPTEYSCSFLHEQASPYDIPSHCVDISKDTPFGKLLEADSLRVNSYHHQAIKNLSSELTVMATSEDGLVEAVYMPGKKYIWAVQWHPEFTLKESSTRKLFSSFVEACGA